MGRYTGPRARRERRFNYPIYGSSKALKTKNYPPGQHGKKPKSRSEYASQLLEKQKTKFIYDVREKYLKRLFKFATRKKGMTGTLMIQLLESRLDSIVRRLGLAPTQAAARQLVNHGHILLNGKKATIPSIQVKVGDQITVRKKSVDLISIKESLERFHKKYDWLSFDPKNKMGKLLQLPDREAIPEKINDQKIVEFYSR